MFTAFCRNLGVDTWGVDTWALTPGRTRPDTVHDDWWRLLTLPLFKYWHCTIYIVQCCQPSCTSDYCWHHPEFIKFSWLRNPQAPTVWCACFPTSSVCSRALRNLKVVNQQSSWDQLQGLTYFAGPFTRARSAVEYSILFCRIGTHSVGQDEGRRCVPRHRALNNKQQWYYYNREYTSFLEKHACFWNSG